MATSKYFNHNINNLKERAVYSDIVEEVICIAGLDLYYIPRIDFETNDVLGRTDFYYNTYKKMEFMMVENNDWTEQTFDFDNFGFKPQGTIQLVCMQRRFKEVFGHDKEPQEGDIIFFPPNKEHLKITWVDDSMSDTVNGDFVMGKTVTYRIICESITLGDAQNMDITDPEDPDDLMNSLLSAKGILEETMDTFDDNPAFEKAFDKIQDKKVDSVFSRVF